MIRAYQIALAGWVGVAGLAAADMWGDLGRLIALASDPFLLVGALLIGALIRPGWVAACGVALLVAGIEWKVSSDWGWHGDHWGHRLATATLLASTAATVRDMIAERHSPA